MQRTVSASLHATVSAPAGLAIQVAVARPRGYDAEEWARITVDDVELDWREIATPHGGRTWVLDVPAGTLSVEYRALLPHPAATLAVEPGDELTYLRPSRYCESDRLVGFAAHHFRHLDRPLDILAAVPSFVGSQLDYASGSSGPTDGAIDTLLAGRGVCRDYAHLVVAMLRALDVPARVVAVYAPGLDPMDFHAVAEALVDGGWYAVDATLLAPRSSLVRIATGRDAADTAFLSNYGGSLSLDEVTVAATVGGELPGDDVESPIQLT